jgi:hypothetical protein
MESTQKEGGENASRQKKKQLTRIKHKYNGENPRKNPPPPARKKTSSFSPPPPPLFLMFVVFLLLLLLLRRLNLH